MSRELAGGPPFRPLHAPGSIKGDVKKKDFSLLGGKEEVPDIQPHSLF
jgi:hypothetical protein